MGAGSPEPDPGRAREGGVGFPEVTPATPRGDRSRSWHAALARRAHLLLPAAIVLLAFVWTVTYGTWRLLDRESFGQFYDAQARSLAHGRWDVPYEAIEFEAFVHDGRGRPPPARVRKSVPPDRDPDFRGQKFYGYFGFTPALPRIPLALLLLGWDGRWSRVSMTLGCGVSLLYACLLLVRLREWLGLGLGPGRDIGWTDRVVYGGFVLSTGLGSTVIFLGSRSYVYHEAAMWGGAMALGCGYHVLGYLATGRPGPLAAACGCAAAAFFCRASVGGGAVAMLALVAGNVASTRLLAARGERTGWLGRRSPLSWGPRVLRALNPWREPPPGWHAAVAGATVLLVGVTFVAVNYAKFRTHFDGAPLRLYWEFLHDPRRLEATGGRLLSARNVRTGLYCYLSPTSIQFLPGFPWVYTVHGATPYPEARYDVIERYSGLPASMPALFGFAVVGLFAARRPVGPARGRAIIPLLGALAGGSTVFAADALTERYLHDFFPFLVLAAAVGVHVVLSLRRAADRRAVWLLAAPAVAFGIWANCAFAFFYQERGTWGVPESRRQQLLMWQETMDRNVSSWLFGRRGAG